MVKPDKVDDLGAIRLVRNITKIESELDYPGQIKVVIIRKPGLWNMRNSLKLKKRPYTIGPFLIKFTKFFP